MVWLTGHSDTLSIVVVVLANRRYRLSFDSGDAVVLYFVGNVRNLLEHPSSSAGSFSSAPYLCSRMIAAELRKPETGEVDWQGWVSLSDTKKFSIYLMRLLGDMKACILLVNEDSE